MGRYFILRGDEVIEEPDYEKWSAWFERDYKEVELVAESRLGGTTVSTRFLALSMTLAQDSPPMIFETKVKGGWLDNQSERFSTLEEATTGHESWVRKVKEIERENELPPPGAGW
jgi:hypothetical protein